MRRVVVVGASLAAVHAVDGLRESGFTGDVTLVGAEPHLPYDRPPLSKEALQTTAPLSNLLLHEPGWYRDRGVELRLGVAADALDTGRRLLRLADRTTIGYDGLVIATGSTTRTVVRADDHIPVRTLRTVEDCAALRPLLGPGRRLVVVGAGFIGLEVAATACDIGMDVVVVEIAPVPLAAALGDEVGSWIQEFYAARGVRFSCGVGVDRVEPAGSGARIRLRDDTHLDADLVVAGVGVRPATGWLADSGVEVADGVVCDEHLRTSVPGIVAAGDVARWFNPLFDEQMRIEHWTNAVEQGRHAAASLLGRSSAYAPVPYFWSDQFSAKLRFVGRANAASDVHVEESTDESLVALYGRDGLVRGALCINAARHLPRYRRAILDQTPWLDVVGTPVPT